MSMDDELYWAPLVPELTVANLATSLAFYLTAGFTVRFQRTDPAFAYLTLGQVQIMLEEEHTPDWRTADLERPLGRGINFQIEVPGVAPMLHALRSAGYPLFREPSEAWYRVTDTQEAGQIEFLVQDPDGYLLRFVEILSGSAPYRTEQAD